MREQAELVRTRELAQDEIGRLRGRLLGGRGPGASDQEIARNGRDRAIVGAVPTVVERELVHVRTQVARGDAAVAERALEVARTDLAASLDQLTVRLAPRWGNPIWAAAFGSAVTLALALLAHRARRLLAARGRPGR